MIEVGERIEVKHFLVILEEIKEVVVGQGLIVQKEWDVIDVGNSISLLGTVQT